MKQNRLLQKLRARLQAASERAAVLVLVGVAMTLILISGALAVDLSALENRGQTLQNTADAAALAGVDVWVETGSQSQARTTIEDVIAQNDVGAGVTSLITFPSATQVRVEMTDGDPDVLLGGVVGLGDQVERDATAEHQLCTAPCGTVVEIPPPFVAIEADGSGDGFVPIIVGTKLYAVNHHDNTITCVDRTTQDECFPQVNAFGGASGSPETGMLSHAALVGSRLYYTGQENSRIRLYCWETATDNSCGSHQLANLGKATYSWDDWYNGRRYRGTRSYDIYQKYRGGGTIGVNDQVFTFTDDHRVQCFDPATGTDCSGYPSGGLSTGLGAAGMAPLDGDEGMTGSNIDRILLETDTETKIYHTLQRIGDRPSSYPSVFWSTPPDRGIYLDCWDVRNASPCAGFTPYRIHGSTWKTQEGRLFFYRDTNGDPTGVCSTGDGRYSIECATLNGSAANGLESSLNALDAALPSSGYYGSRGMGSHYYHPESNQVIIASSRQVNRDYCFNFDATGGYCGSIYGTSPYGAPYDYGFTSEGNCIFGLGHSTVFWSFSSDMSGICPGTGTSEYIYKCQCGAVEQWPNPQLNFDVGPGTAYISFDIQLRDPDGNIVFPDSGDWVELVDHPTGTLDLSDVSTSHAYLEIFIEVELDRTQPDPWLAGTPPTVILQIDKIPNLVE